MLWQFLSRVMMLQANSGLGELVQQLVDEVAVRLPSWRDANAAPKRRSSQPWLEILEGRLTPSTTWKPAANNQNASVASNWTAGLPSPTVQAVFDGNVSQLPCIFDFGLMGGATYNGMLVQNGYKGVWEITANQKVNSNALVEIQKNCMVNLKIDAGNNPLGLISGAKVQVDAGGTLSINDNGIATTFLASRDNNNNGKGGEILSNSGTVSYIGTAAPATNGALQDHIDVPVLNEGTFYVNGGFQGVSTTIGSILNVTGTDALTKSVSWYQDTDNAITSVSGEVWLNASSGYTQTAGLFDSIDNYTDHLEVLNNGTYGTININGGKVAVDPGTSTFGSLGLTANTVNCSGEIDVKVNTTNNVTADLISVTGGTGVLNFKAGASFVVNPTPGPAQAGKGKWGAVLTTSGGITGWANVNQVKNGTKPANDGMKISVTS